MSQETLAARKTLNLKIAITFVWLGIAIIALTTVSHYQQKAIDSLVFESKVAEAYRSTIEQHVQALQRVIHRHIDEGCIAQGEEAKIIRRIDLAVRQVNQMTREFQ